MAVTLAEVAARAGVSLVTASRALRAPERLALGARACVEAAMRELGDVPNFVASALASARTRSVAVLVPTIANSTFASTVEGVSATLEPRGYAVLLSQAGYDPSREKQASRALLAPRPEALIMVGSPATPAGTKILRQSAVRVVETWKLPPEPVDAVVGFDNRAVGMAVDRYLIGLGRHRLCSLGGTDARALQRYAGFSEAACCAGIPTPQRIDVPASGSADAASARMAAIGEADGVFTSTDVYAVGVLSGLRAAGRFVPEDIAVVGLGDLEIGHHTTPALTTVRIDGRGIGEAAARIVSSESSPRIIDVGFELIIRGSG